MLNILVGALGLLVAVTFFLLFNGASYFSAELQGFATAAVMAVMGVLALPMILVGIALLQFRPWARMAGVILAAFSFLHFPLGSMLAAYELSVLLSTDADRLFNPRFNSLYIRRPD
ncbi:MAG TPA: hypothetical protein VKG25_22615 [Bryobacteraceae bacterium]|nr:hypothetical protein [Bryobacteraceae bacterium]